jgi:hypothetical protein
MVWSPLSAFHPPLLLGWEGFAEKLYTLGLPRTLLIHASRGTIGSQKRPYPDSTVSGNVSNNRDGVFVRFGAIRVLDSAIYVNFGYGPWGSGLNDVYVDYRRSNVGVY